MTSNEILAQVAAIVRDTLGCGDVKIDRSTQAFDIRGWDSLSQTMILLRIESEFNISVPIDEAMQLANVGELVDLVARQRSNT